MKKIRIIALILTVALTLALFAACTPKLADIKAKYEDAGYTILDTQSLEDLFGSEDDEEATESDAEIEWAFIASKGSFLGGNYKFATCVCYKDSADAQEAYDEAKKVAEEEADEDYVVVKKGNAIIVGNKEAVEVA